MKNNIYPIQFLFTHKSTIANLPELSNRIKSDQHYLHRFKPEINKQLQKSDTENDTENFRSRLLVFILLYNPSSEFSSLIINELA